MENLTAKVFRTYNASWTLQAQLKELTDPDSSVAEKVLTSLFNKYNTESTYLQLKNPKFRNIFR